MKKIILQLLILVSVAGIGRAQNSNNGTLYLLEVGATNDYNVGQAVKKSFENMEIWANLIVQNIPELEDVKIIKITGLSLSKSLLMKKLNTLSTNEKDVIITSVSTHGFHFDDQKIKYPNLFLYQGNNRITPNPLELKRNYIVANDLVDMLKIKKAHLKLFFIESCNNILYGLKKPTNFLVLHVKYNSNWEKLFINTSGNYTFYSCSLGQESIAINNISLFYSSFFNVFYNLINYNDCSWPKIFRTTTNSVTKKESSQTPFFETIW